MDQRGGRPPRWVVLPEGVERLMQVPDHMRKAVVFLYCIVKDGEEPRAAGTAFYAGYRVPGYEPEMIPVLLTALHVIAAIRKESVDGKVLVRVNTAEGAEFVEFSVDDWCPADQTRGAVDCAVLVWRRPEFRTDLLGWDLLGSATEAVMQREGLGIGDEVFLVGLFRNHLGRDRNEPIVRVGNIAALPSDPVHTKHFGDMKAILVEARSIGGLSGSPVFVHPGYSRFREGQMMHFTGERPFMFLGLMHGHWEMLEAEGDASIAGNKDEEKLNTGIAAVVPVEQILSGIEDCMKEAVDMRIRELQQREQDNVVTPDTALDSDRPEEFEKFKDLTRKLVNTPKSEVDEKRKGES